MDCAAMLDTFYDIRQAHKDENGLLNNLLSIFERMKELKLSRGTGTNIHENSLEEDGLLDGGITILKHMKVLNGSRGADMEALAQAHVAEVNRLNEESQAHVAEINRLNEKSRAHVAEVDQLYEKYTTDVQDNLQYIEDLDTFHKEEIHELRTREISLANTSQGRVLAAYFEVEIGKIKLEFDKAIARQVEMFRKLEKIVSSRDAIARRALKYATRTNYVFNQLHTIRLHVHIPRDLQLASTGFSSLIDDSKGLRDDMQREVDRRIDMKDALREYSEMKEKKNKSACYRRVKKLLELVAKTGLKMKPYFMDELFEYDSSKTDDDGGNI